MFVASALLYGVRSWLNNAIATEHEVLTRALNRDGQVQEARSVI